MDAWCRDGLPERLDGLSFIDVGCWEGGICAEAVARGASFVLGVDYCTSPDLRATMETSNFSFLQLDILSEKALQLPEFDVVRCAGVLYHVENPLSLLFRLRKLGKLGGAMHIETTVAIGPSHHPLMIFHPGDTLDANPSNWWSPNLACLMEMLAIVGLTDIEQTHLNEPTSQAGDYAIGRTSLRGRIANGADSLSDKILPRRPTYMPQSAGQGNRHGVAR